MLCKHVQRVKGTYTEITWRSVFFLLCLRSASSDHQPLGIDFCIWWSCSEPQRVYSFYNHLLHICTVCFSPKSTKKTPHLPIVFQLSMASTLPLIWPKITPPPHRHLSPHPSHCTSVDRLPPTFPEFVDLALLWAMWSAKIAASHLRLAVPVNESGLFCCLSLKVERRFRLALLTPWRTRHGLVLPPPFVRRSRLPSRR